MKLNSTDGNCVELDVVGYQFPGHHSDGTGHDWDANWLVVRGKIRLDDGRMWQFEDPCMTTWEAERLSSWLKTAASEVVSPPTPDDDGDRCLVFTEPNLAFGTHPDVAGEAVIRVYFSSESAPPWEKPGELLEYFVPITLPRSELSDAAQEWQKDLTSFPRR